MGVTTGFIHFETSADYVENVISIQLNYKEVMECSVKVVVKASLGLSKIWPANDSGWTTNWMVCD